MTFAILGLADTWHLFAAGLRLTTELFVLAAVLGFGLGAALAALRQSNRWAAPLVIGFVEYHRNVPSLVQLLVWYFAIPQVLPEILRGWIERNLDGFVFAIVALSLNAAAYISEDLRSGFRTLPKGQFEATEALGLSRFQALRLVLLPQAVRACFPALVSQTLSLFKATTLAMAIGVGELMYVARRIDGETYATFAAFLVPTIMYLCCTLAIMFGGERLQQRLVATGVDCR